MKVDSPFGDKFSEYSVTLAGLHENKNLRKTTLRMPTGGWRIPEFNVIYNHYLEKEIAERQLIVH